MRTTTKKFRCDAPGCPATEHYALKCCKKHWTQLLRHGRYTPERERGAVRNCGAKGCERRASVSGHCRRHARQVRKHGMLMPQLEREIGKYAHCTVKECKAPHRAKGLCGPHYSKARWAAQQKLATRKKGR